jgi:cadmium resistance transport/sequestration family protein
MDRVLRAIVLGVTSFIATNLDDIVVLMIFFAQVNPSLRWRHIVLGQYLGFAVLLFLCVPGYFGGLMLSKAWIGVLGLVPIAVGIYQLWNAAKISQVQGIAQKERMVESTPPTRGSSNLLAPPTYQVAAVTFANGGDNVSVYVPLFARSTLLEIGVILSIFGAMVGVWCWVAAQLAQHSAIAPALNRYGHRLTPFILIGLGIYILLENGTVQGLLSVLSSSPLK